MNGRERILAAVRRDGSTDRVPLGEMGFDSEILARLHEHFGVQDPHGLNEALGIDLVCGLVARSQEVLAHRLLIFKTSDDIATQRGLMFSPELWRKHFKAPMARQFATAKKLGLITMLHSCGAVREVLNDFVEIGLDILEPTQVHVAGMAATEIKREFGRHLTFFGAICTQRTLPHGTPADIRKEVHSRIEVLGVGGGYICSPDHCILDDVPLENVLALYDAAREYGR